VIYDELFDKVETQEKLSHSSTRTLRQSGNDALPPRNVLASSKNPTSPKIGPSPGCGLVCRNDRTDDFIYMTSSDQFSGYNNLLD